VPSVYDALVQPSERFHGLKVADVMLREPKTAPSSATVGDVRALLAHPGVQMVLLADGALFFGAITEIPEGASDDEEALRYAEPSPESLRADEPAVTAFDRTSKNPHRRVVVLGEENELVGLVCLNQTRTRFCGGPDVTAA
jgi:CBS domain-containing protein